MNNGSAVIPKPLIAASFITSPLFATKPIWGSEFNPSFNFENSVLNNQPSL